jgi:hypothetical protein
MWQEAGEDPKPVRFTKYYWDDQLKEVKMNRKCSTHSRDEKNTTFWLENL